MKKFLIITLVLVLITSAFAGCASKGDSKSGTEGQETYLMKIAHHTSETDPLHLGYKFFGDKLTEKSEGRIKYEIYPNKQISSGDVEVAVLIQQNTVQMSSIPQFAFNTTSETLKEWNVFDFPYLFNGDEELYKFVDSATGDRLREKAYEVGLKAYPSFNIGWQKISSNKQPIALPTDVKGLKIRCGTSDLLINFLKNVGASPTPMAYGETFTALQQKTVDGMCTSTTLYVSDRFYEVQKYMGVVDFAPITHTPIISKEWYEGLPEDLQVIVDECAAEYVEYARKICGEAEQQSKKTLAENGMTVTELTEEQRAEWAKAGEPLWNDFVDVAGKEVLSEAKALLNK